MITEGFELADYACSSANSRGRAIEEKSSTSRTEFQRDRDRIIHSSAFRRLEYKTQVFVNHEGDLFRTRLTHTLEVAQIARTTATLLKINPDLTEAIALAHDLGHTPFGHSGQTALDRCMADFGGFEHNLQSLRIVDLLEDQYPNFDGLNLTWETREGILKHCSRENALRLGALGERFLKGEQPSLEAQLVNIADAIAYSTHDIDDGLRVGYLDEKDLIENVPLYAEYHAQVDAEYPDIQELLCAADIMVTDYSSCIFDFMLSRKPAFFYAEDIEKYNQERGFYFPMSETPFPIAQNTDELVKNLLEFNENKYLEEIDAFLKGKGAFEDGNASKRAADFIERLPG